MHLHTRKKEQRDRVDRYFSEINERSAIVTQSDTNS